MQSVISNLSLLVIHAADLDDILFEVVDFCAAGRSTNLKLEVPKALKDMERPLKVALLHPQLLLAQPEPLPSVLNYAYFPLCISEFLGSLDVLEDIEGPSTV